MELLHREFPRDGTGSLVLSPDGKLVAIWTGPNTRKLYLWDWQGADEPREVKVPRQRVDCLVFSPDGKALLACGDLEPFVYEWDVATGDLKHQIELRDDIYSQRPGHHSRWPDDRGHRLWQPAGQEFQRGRPAAGARRRGSWCASCRPPARRPKTSSSRPMAAGWRPSAESASMSGTGESARKWRRAPPVIRAGSIRSRRRPAG